ncbi:hypothetical protein SH580_20545 [Coraliomargarita algicola]|uniref:Lipoprotein n=1 Tax=Coraliomargarita algicola TaxID=3092156 RepID=A0ABZ0RLL4_9BACT|nr:hypothetical protein [Coraliomargarita sp. J2-16]WPJ95812.1 hypothetical protein SH580_20545 [Coraliomargarita sp. J2-16]
MKLINVTASLILSFCMLIGMTACSTSSAIRTSVYNYEATLASEVQILTSYPQAYETLGLVEASAPKGYLCKAERATDAALRALKQRAAELGAEAIVLKDYAASSVPDFSLGGSDLGVLLSSERKHITGEAIRFKLITASTR